MTDQGSNDLMKLLGTCADALQSALIVKTGKNVVFSVISDKREFYAPPLRPNMMFVGTDLNDLPRALYCDQHMLMGMRQEIWDCVVDEFFYSGKVVKLCKVYCPSITFTAEPPSAALAQLLCALSWHGGTFEVTKTSATLKMARGVLPIIIINHRTVTHRGVPRRLPGGYTVAPSTLLARPLGRTKTGTPETTAVYRHLAVEFPEFVPALDVIFSTAVHAGREFEAILTRLFNINAVDDITPTASVWVKARRIVNTAIQAPYVELWDLFKGTMSHTAFVKLFGNPYRGRAIAYSTQTRQRHAKVIDKAENGEIDFLVYQQVGGQLEAANSLLKLQQLMGSPA